MVGAIPGTLPQPAGPGHTRHPKQGLRPPVWGQVVSPWILRDGRQSTVLTFPPGHRHHRVTGIFSTFPVASEGTEELGALQPSDPDETPRARQNHPSSPQSPRWEGRMLPSQRSARRAGSDVGKARGAAHAGRGALPAGPGVAPGPAPPTRPGRRRHPLPARVG